MKIKNLLLNKKLSVLITVGMMYGALVGLNHLWNNSTKVWVCENSEFITKRRAHGAFGRTREYIAKYSDKTHKAGRVYHSVDKSHIFLGGIELIRYTSGYSKYDEVILDNFFKYISYKDGEGYGNYDGIVDVIRISENHPINGISGYLYRDKNYKEFKKEFDKGDRVLAEAKEKFKDYFSK